MKGVGWREGREGVSGSEGAVQSGRVRTETGRGVTWGVYGGKGD